MEQKQADTEQESFTVDVAHAFEVMAEAIGRMEKRVVELEQMLVSEHKLVGMLFEAVKCHQRVIETQANWKPIALKSTSVN